MEEQLSLLRLRIVNYLFFSSSSFVSLELPHRNWQEEVGQLCKALTRPFSLSCELPSAPVPLEPSSFFRSGFYGASLCLFFSNEFSQASLWVRRLCISSWAKSLFFVLRIAWNDFDHHFLDVFLDVHFEAADGPNVNM